MKNRKENTTEIDKIINLTKSEIDTQSLQKFEQKIKTLSNLLDISPAPITPPITGFLKEPLSQKDFILISEILDPIYAKKGVLLQKEFEKGQINESGEKMVNLINLLNDNNITYSVSSEPFHQACGEWAGKSRIFWARNDVANRLLKISKVLNKIGYMVHLEDAFRPIGVQEGLFLRRVTLILDKHPDWINDWDKVWKEARSKTAVKPAIAGHKSGAALDITLRTLSGTPLNIGNEYPAGGSKVAIDFPYLTQEEWESRKLFVIAMESVGLMVYPFENWHVSHGDLPAGIRNHNNYTAKYGPIRDFDPETGIINPHHPSEYNVPFYTKDEIISLIKKQKHE
jgi:D-alanyl-D-alanine dipeptidase